MTNRRAILSTLFLCCSFSVMLRAEAAPVDLTIALPSPNLGAFAALGTADKAGLFAANGIVPHFKIVEGGPVAIAALIAGSVQFAVAGPSEVINAEARGMHLVFIANLYRGLSGSLVLSKSVAARIGTKPDSPVGDRLRALDGMLIAVPSPSSSLLTPIKAAADAVHAKIRFTYMAQDAMAAALRAGSIDGMVASSPIWASPVEGGTGVLWIDGPKGELPSDLLPIISGALATTADYARNNPDGIQRMLSTLNSLVALVHDDPARAEAAFAATYPQLSPASAKHSFLNESGNFTQPLLTVPDILHEMKNLFGDASRSQIDPSRILYSK